MALHYFVEGNRNFPYIICLHGFLGSGQDWQPFARKLRDRFCVVLPDLPGHGQSVGLADANYTFAGCLDALATLFDQLEIGAAHLAGYSMGGRLALGLALKYPGRFQSLFLESSSPGIVSESARRRRLEQDRMLAEKLICAPFHRFLGDWYRQPLFGELVQSPFYEEMLRRRRQNSQDELAKALVGMSPGAQPSFWQHLRSLKKPLLYVFGSRDEKYKKIAAQVLQHLPSAAISCIADSGHSAHVEQPELFYNIMDNFIRSGGKIS